MNPTPRRPWRTAALFAFGAALAAQQPDKPAVAPARTEKLQAWPKLQPDERARIAALVNQFDKGKEELVVQAHKDLVATGESVAQVLLPRISDREGVDNGPVLAVLDEVLDRRHADLLAKELKKKGLCLRQYVARRLCQFADPDQKAALLAASKDKDEDIAFYGNVGLLALGDTSALAAVVDRCRTDWKEQRPLVAAALPAARSDACGKAVAEFIAKAQTPAQATGLKLMRYLATKDHVVIVRSYLAAEDNGVKREAVNTMRALHGQEPIEDLPVFQVIEMAKEWQNK